MELERNSSDSGKPEIIRSDGEELVEDEITEITAAASNSVVSRRNAGKSDSGDEPELEKLPDSSGSSASPPSSSSSDSCDDYPFLIKKPRRTKASQFQLQSQLAESTRSLQIQEKFLEMEMNQIKTNKEKNEALQAYLDTCSRKMEEEAVFKKEKMAIHLENQVLEKEERKLRILMLRKQMSQPDCSTNSTSPVNFDFCGPEAPLDIFAEFTQRGDLSTDRNDFEEQSSAAVELLLPVVEEIIGTLMPGPFPRLRDQIQASLRTHFS